MSLLALLRNMPVLTRSANGPRSIADLDATLVHRFKVNVND